MTLIYSPLLALYYLIQSLCDQLGDWAAVRQLWRNYVRRKIPRVVRGYRIGRGRTA